MTTAPFGQYDTFSGTNAAVVITETWLDNSMNPVAQPQIGGSVKIEVNAQGAQVITPLIRPFFGCSNGGNPYCLVHISATTIMRLEPNAVATPGP